MNIGFGSLKQMNDTLRYNREILPKRKSAREVYREEIKKRVTTGADADLELVRTRVRKHLRRNRRNEMAHKVAVIVVPLLLAVGLVWVFVTFDFTTKNKTFRHKEELFITYTYSIAPGVECRTDYFPTGPKAAETYLVERLKHHTAYSYYESGEIFRKADYYRDTLLRESFFFKNGDTIRNFPEVRMDSLQHIELFLAEDSSRMSFDFFGGKMVGGTYTRINLSRINP